MQNISGSQASPEIPINENFGVLAAFAVYGLRAPATSGLNWGYWGGRYNGFVVPNGVLTLVANSTNYILVNIVSGGGAITVSTSQLDWDNTSTYRRVYKITTNATSVTVYEDHRIGASGLFA